MRACSSATTELEIFPGRVAALELDHLLALAEAIGRRRHGFAAVSGTEIDLDLGGVPTGRVKRHFDEWDKLEFVASYSKANGIDLAECIAVGDSRSDALDTENLTDILDLIPWR